MNEPKTYTAEEQLGIGWPVDTARKWMTDLAAMWRADAKHMMANLDASATQEEFELFLEHGIGLDDEGVAAAIAQVLGKEEGGRGGLE
jgi:D-serine deaminase-like pyridoxal phosphate-dependent protein